MEGGGRMEGGYVDVARDGVRKTQKKKRKEKGRSRMRDVPALFVVSRCAVLRYQLLWQGLALKAIRPRFLALPPTIQMDMFIFAHRQSSGAV